MYKNKIKFEPVWPNALLVMCNMLGQHMRLGYFYCSFEQWKAQSRLYISSDWLEPSLLTPTNVDVDEGFCKKSRPLAPLGSCTCIIMNQQRTCDM